MITIVLLSGLIIMTNVVIFCKIWKYYALRKKLKHIPSPKFLPLIGFISKFTSMPKEDQSQWLNDLCLKYEEGMILIWLGTEPRLIINSPKYAEIVLTSNTLITKGKTYNVARPWLGNGLLMSTGDSWLKQRRMLAPAFHFKVLEEYAQVMQRKVEILVECIEARLSKNQNAPINIFEVAVNFSLDTICEAAMGLDIDSQRKPANEYVNALHKFSALSIERAYSLWLRSDALYFRTAKGKEALKCIKVMHEFSEKVLTQRMSKRQKQKSTNTNIDEIDEFGARKPKAFLDLLLDESEQADNPLTITQIREELDTFIFAGHDTSAVSITWALFTLGNALEIQAKVHDELEEVFGDETSIATTKQLNQLKYLDRVIKEVLRLYPSGPAISRYADRDFVIGGHLIPEGTTITCNFYQLHRNPRVWEDPEKFDPDRFLPENIRSKSLYAYVPFSAGPRNCIGQKFAVMELKIVLTAILRRWKVTSVLKPREVKVVQNFVLRPYDEKVELHFTPVKSIATQEKKFIN